MIAERAAQGLVQQMRGRMVRANGAAAAVIHNQFRGLPCRNLAFCNLGDMQEQARNLFRV